MIGRPPLAIAVQAGCRERSKSLNALVLVRHPETEGKCPGTRRRGIDRVVEIGKPTVELSKQQADEQIGRRHRSANRSLPQWNRAVSSGRDDTTVMNPQIISECSKRRRSPFIEK